VRASLPAERFDAVWSSIFLKVSELLALLRAGTPYSE
jgi:hypothetical protein